MPCFVMSKENLNAIRSNYYWLLKKGFSLDELKNLEPNEFQFYIYQFKDEIETERENARKAYQKSIS